MEKLRVLAIIFAFLLAIGAAGFYTIKSLENDEVVADDVVVDDDVTDDQASGDENDALITNSSNLPSYSDILVDGVTIGVPFGNGRGVVALGDAIVTMHSVNGVVYVDRHTASGGGAEVSSVQLTTKGDNGYATPNSLTEENGLMLALWTGKDGMFAMFSHDDGKSFEAAQKIAERSNGNAVPSSCIWMETSSDPRAMIAWVDPEVGDGGPMYESTWNNGVWSEPEQILTDIGSEVLSSPSLNCEIDQQMMSFRYDQGGSLSVYHAVQTNDAWSDPVYIAPGADPHLAACNNTIWVGYHHGGARLSFSEDNGASWTHELLDETGKFGAIACEGSTVIALYGDYLSQKDANQKAEDSRRLGARVSFDSGTSWEDWRAAGEEVNQGTSTCDVSEDGSVVAYWRATGAARVATYPYED